MHTPETRQKFIEPRADAQSIPNIASLLGVAQSTLRLWEKDDALEIAHLRCSYWQDAEDKVGITIEHRLRRMAEWIKGAEDELEKRHFELMNNRDLMRFLREARREYFRLRAMLFDAPGARASSPAATTAKSRTTKPNPAPRAEPSTEDEIPDAKPSDKIGELADFPETQPRNTNDLQQPKSSPADFPTLASAPKTLRQIHVARATQIWKHPPFQFHVALATRIWTRPSQIHSQILNRRSPRAHKPPARPTPHNPH